MSELIERGLPNLFITRGFGKKSIGIVPFYSIVSYPYYYADVNQQW